MMMHTTTSRSKVFYRGELLSTVIGLSLVSLLIGCHVGPDGEGLQSDLQSRLDGHFGKGVLKVNDVARRGSYPYAEEGDDRERLLIYYNATLAFQKAHKLSNWDQANVSSLISVLGATPLGVEGVNPSGNASGDELHIHGAAAYAKKGNDWEPAIHVAGAQKQPDQPPASEESPPYRKRMEAIATIGKQLQLRNRQRELRSLEEDLDQVLFAAERRLARSRGWITVATGTSPGEYFTLGRGLEKLLSGKRLGSLQVKARSVSTGGSEENCRLVEAREVEFAFSQNDIAHMAHTGTGLFERDVPLKNLRALSSLYPEAVQIVTLKKSGIRALGDLRGKRINIGVKGSGMRINALQVLEAAGLGLAEFAEVRGSGREEAVQQLREGQIDALFLTGAYPANDVLQLASSHSVKLIPLEEEVTDALKQRYPFFIPVHIPRNTYPDMEQEGLTVAVTAMLIAHRDTKNERVEFLLETIFSDVPALSQGSLSAYFISKGKASVGISIPLHPAAKRFLE